MKITKSKLRRVIREELRRHLLSEQSNSSEAEARLVVSVLPPRTFDMDTGLRTMIDDAMSQGKWDIALELVRSNPKYDVNTGDEAYEKLLSNMNFPGIQDHVLLSMFKGLRNSGGDAHAVSWALEKGAEFESPEVEQAISAWAQTR